jgi:hypothetical protein
LLVIICIYFFAIEEEMLDWIMAIDDASGLSVAPSSLPPSTSFDDDISGHHRRQATINVEDWVEAMPSSLSSNIPSQWPVQVLMWIRMYDKVDKFIRRQDTIYWIHLVRERVSSWKLVDRIF